MQTIITVEQHHVDRGRRSDPDACPIALALIECTGQSWMIDNYAAYCLTTGASHNFDALTRSWIEAFDSGESVLPLTFNFDL